MKTEYGYGGQSSEYGKAVKNNENAEVNQ